ncbi:Frd2 domain-containing protein [Serratia phage 4S]|nr:Frd2 domain-containing protein [Serratia phage 4S]
MQVGKFYALKSDYVDEFIKANTANKRMVELLKKKGAFEVLVMCNDDGEYVNQVRFSDGECAGVGSITVNQNYFELFEDEFHLFEEVESFYQTDVIVKVLGDVELVVNKANALATIEYIKKTFGV